MLLLSVPSNTVLEAVLHTNKVILGAAAVVALFAILDERPKIQLPA
jgi:hypothetical protein